MANDFEFRVALAKKITKHYCDEEEGSLIAFSLFIFICMLLIGGLAFDMMLYENDRTHIQNSTDRAVLAAANLDQTVDPKVVVQDYLAKVGIDIEQDDVNVVQTGTFPVITGRQVSINIDADRPTVFMNMAGVNSLPLGAFSEAQEAVNDIEVSLILDVSGSMTQGQKLPQMKAAATDFVTKILDGAGTVDNRVSLSLVPYSTQVSLGPELIAQVNTTHNHNYSYCVNFNNDSDFTTTAIDHSTSLSQTAHFDPWYWHSWGQSVTWPVCRGAVDAAGNRNDESFHIVPWSNNITALNNQINAMTGSGNTSIDLAVKWGAALLDPSMQSTLTAMSTPSTGNVNPLFNGRPFNFTRPDTLKFMVVMTDGINTTQYYLKNSYKSGDSNVWRDSLTGRYTVEDEEWRDTGDGDGDWWEDYYWVFNTYQDDKGTSNTDDDETITQWPRWDDDLYDYDENEGQADGDPNDNESVVTRLSWIDMWASMNMSWRAYNFYYRQDWDADDYYDNLYGPRNYVTASKKDERLSDICEAARNEGIVIFTVGFEVTDASAVVMEDCASSPSHFYRVDGTEIEYAFASIANQINQLKLTQ